MKVCIIFGYVLVNLNCTARSGVRTALAVLCGHKIIQFPSSIVLLSTYSLNSSLESFFLSVHTTITTLISWIGYSSSHAFTSSRVSHCLSTLRNWFAIQWIGIQVISIISIACLINSNASITSHQTSSHVMTTNRANLFMHSNENIFSFY